MKPIVFVLQDFDEGGVQRVTLKNLNQMSKDGNDVTLIVMKGSATLSKFLSENVKLVLLKKRKVLFSIISLVKTLSTLKASNLVSAIVQVNILVAIANALILFRHHHIITEHTHSTLASENAERWNLKIAYSLQRLFYPLASRIYCVSQGVVDDLLYRVPSVSSKISLITNPVVDDAFYENAKQKVPSEILSFISSKKVVLGVGRLVKSKDFQLLIDSFTLVKQELEDSVLLIVGEGPEESNLRNQVSQNNHRESINLVGHFDNPLPLFCLADVFVLTSKYEGFGLVLVEALALSRSVVSVDCETGPREILKDVGTLVENRNPQVIANAIIDSLVNIKDTSGLKERARYFNSSEVAKLYYEGFV